MLAALLAGHRAQLRALAGAWLAAGATAYALNGPSGLLAQWPPDAVVAPGAWTIARLCLGEEVLGSIGVAGLGGLATEARLQAEAELLLGLIEAETQLDIMTAEMVDTQDQLLALYDLTRSTRAHLDLDGTLELLAQESARLARTDGAFAALCTEPPDGPVSLVQAPAASELPASAVIALFRQAQAGNTRLLLNEGDASGLLPPGARNLLLQPVEVSGRMLAGLGLVNKETNFTSPDLKLLRAIAEQAGAQIENVLLHREVVEQTRMQTEMAVARSVQVRLLPTGSIRTPGLDVYGASRAALQVGGDFFDFILRPRRPFTFALGDVSGKGMPAALLMAMSRSSIRSKARFTEAPTPASLLYGCNQELYDDFTEVGAFATVFAGQYDPAKRCLTYANAGHSPVIYRSSREGAARSLEADGPPVGVLPVSLCQDYSLRFESGDLLVVASDGFAEARSAADELYGYERLLRLVNDCADLPAACIAEVLFDAVAEFASGHPQDDDQTLVVLKGSSLAATPAAAQNEDGRT